ncbi:MAG: ComEC/Rec2 family competence protein [Ruminococcus sp.]
MKSKKALKIGTAIISAVLIVLISFGAFGLSWQKIFVWCGFYADKSQELSVSFIDVGKADAVFITCDDYNILIDAGEDIHAEAVSAYLKRYKTESLDLLIATHPDKDHIGGMEKIINDFEIKSFWQPKISDDLIPKTACYENMISALNEKSISVINPKAGYKEVLGNMTLTVLSPHKEYGSTNNDSLVIRLDYYGRSFLFMGDAEKEAEQDLIKNNSDALRADVLKISHHGSNKGSINEFLQLVSPEYAVLSVGENTSNLPSKACVQRINDNDIKLLRTDLQGTITINSLKNGEIKVHFEK